MFFNSYEFLKLIFVKENFFVRRIWFCSFCYIKIQVEFYYLEFSIAIQNL